VYRGQRISVKLSRYGAAWNQRRLLGKPLYFQENSPENRPRCGTKATSCSGLQISGADIPHYPLLHRGGENSRKDNMVDFFSYFQDWPWNGHTAKPGLATIFRSKVKLGNEGN
jgi:hypothetical protein